MAIFSKEFDALLYEGTTPLDDEFVNEPNCFVLEVGESCKVKQTHVDLLTEAGKFKMLWTRVDRATYRWLSSDGDIGTTMGDGDKGGVEFSTEFWEKVEK